MKRIGWLEKWTLRYAVVGLVFLAMVGFEGALLRTQLLAPGALAGMESLLNTLRPVGREVSPAELFYAMLTAHPVVGIYGFAYMCVMGAFSFLVPFLLKKEIRHRRLVPACFWLQAGGVLLCWGAGFFALFNALYTLYWPLPVSLDRVPVAGGVVFALGLVLIEVSALLFAYNMFGTILSKGPNQAQGPVGFLGSAFAIPRLLRLLTGKKAEPSASEPDDPPEFIVAVARGTVDTVINALVFLTVAALLLTFYLPAALAGIHLNPAAIDSLVYKNWLWWGLDMIADGNVLMYTAGTWYLLVPLLVGRKLYGGNVVRWVILADLLVSLFVWSHHLLGDRAQPLALRLLSGQFVTWGEFVTMGLTVFSVMMTIWLARPVTFTPPLKFVMGSIFGFVVGGASGLVQANLGLNLVLHNTQWVVGIHAHMLLLGGLGMLLFAVIYALLPMLAKVQIRSSKLVDAHFWAWLGGTVIMTYAMGMAGSRGMLRRTIYTNGPYQLYMAVALAGAVLIAAGFAFFLVNILVTLGWRNVLGLILPERWLAPRPGTAEA